ncbi:MAG TPA: ATP-binding protein [Acholeplasmatales bacterium]|nr:MAG: ATP-binding protein [Tenericutes bacterium GWF2_57_13]HAQ55865.1 ATP-binding protein [Acholeplasmatales bacterium]
MKEETIKETDWEQEPTKVECDHDCDSCTEKCDEPVDFRAKLNEMSHVEKTIAVVSGKGGVGKSMVTSLLAVATRRRGYQTAILDADLTGPSIPKVFGLKERATQCDFGILPVLTETKIKVMSINLLIENETDPVVWRGPLIANTVKQFWTDVVWDQVDYMFIDMPPGTGDVPLTVFQSLPVDGIIIVASPQELVSMIVTKSVRMAEMMKIPIIGIVENMSYAICPGCHEPFYLFGKSHIEEVAAEHRLDILARIPIDPAYASACDDGTIEQVSTDVFSIVADRIIQWRKAQ